MAFLIPKSEPLEWWESWLWTGGGGKHQFEVIIYADQTVELALRAPVQGLQEKLYRFSGKHLPRTSTYGELHLTRLEKQIPMLDASQAGIEVDLADFENMLRFEYFRVEKTHHDQHPRDALSMMRDLGHAGWNEEFDVFVVMHPFVETLLEALHINIEEPSRNTRVPNPEILEEVEVVLRELDKRKFVSVQRASS
mgnify:CR=1 FL=1